MNTGNGQGKAADLVVDIALSTTSGPYGVLTDSSLFVANRVVAQSRTQDIYLPASRSVDPAGKLNLVQTPARSRLQKAAREVVEARAVTSALNRVLAQIPASGEDVEDYKVMAAAFQVGAAQQGKLQIYEGDLDSHTSHPGNHLQSKPRAGKK